MQITRYVRKSCILICSVLCFLKLFTNLKSTDNNRGKAPEALRSADFRVFVSCPQVSLVAFGVQGSELNFRTAKYFGNINLLKPTGYVMHQQV